MKKIVVFCLVFLLSFSTLFRGLIFDFEIYFFLAAEALLFITYFLHKLRSGESICFNKAYTLIGVLLITAYGISHIAAINPRENFEAILQYGCYLLIYTVLYDYFKDNKLQYISTILYPTIISGFVCAVLGMEGLTEIEILGARTVNYRLGASFQYPNTAAIYFVICLLFVLIAINLVKSPILGSLLSGLGNCMLLALFYSGSRGGFLAGVAAVIVLLVLQPHGYRLKTALSLLCISVPVFLISKEINKAITLKSNYYITIWLLVSFMVSAVLFILIMVPLNGMFGKNTKSKYKVTKITLLAVIGLPLLGIVIFTIYTMISGNRFTMILPDVLGKRLENLSMGDKNIQLRLEFFRDALKIIRNNWMTGAGRGGWKALYYGVQEYNSTIAFSHNNYLEVFIESGILGFLSIISITLIALVGAFISYLKSMDNSLKICFSGIFCSLLSLTAHSAIDIDLSFISMQFLIWMLFVASAQYKERNNFATGKKPVLLGLITLSVIIFSMNSLYFTGAYNEQQAIRYMDKGDYKSAILYYEEASRFDPRNSVFLSERAMLYTFFARKSEDNTAKVAWLDKARSAAERATKEFRYYPYYVDILSRAYLASDMPLQALEKMEWLTSYQKYRRENYELFAQCYIDAANYYIKKGNSDTAKAMLKGCLAIKTNPYYLRSTEDVVLKEDLKKAQKKDSTESKMQILFEHAAAELNRINY